ncbi:MAG: hypothetical protein ACREDF_04995, partial [Thermoplasmata archaeon]
MPKLIRSLVEYHDHDQVREVRKYEPACPIVLVLPLIQRVLFPPPAAESLQNSRVTILQPRPSLQRVSPSLGRHVDLVTIAVLDFPAFSRSSDTFVHFPSPPIVLEYQMDDADASTVTARPHDRSPTIVMLDRDALERGLAEEAQESARGVLRVSCGRPQSEDMLVIV